MSTQKLEISPMEIMASYITDVLGKMTDPDDKTTWPLYQGHIPDGEEVETNCGGIYDTAGINDPRSMDGTVNEHPGIQLRIRARDYEIGFAKIEDIAAALDAVIRETIVVGSSTYRLQNVSRTTPIVSLGVEPGTKRRIAFTVNYLITVKKLS